MPAQGETRASRTKLHWVYFLLAGFDLVTVGFSLLLISWIMSIYTRSVDENQRWANRTSEFASLTVLAANANAPGNDVFTTRDVEFETRRLERATDNFKRKLSMIRMELQDNVHVDVVDDLLRKLDEVDVRADEMSSHATMIFSSLSQQRVEVAGEHMAAMDRSYAKLIGQLTDLGEDVRAIQNQQLDHQRSQAASLRRYELAVVVMIVAMVCGIALYGRRMAKQISLGAQELRRLNERLGVRVEQRTAELATMNEKLTSEIDQHRSVEEALRERESRLQAILSTAVDGIITIDAQGTIENLNPAVEKIFEYGRDELLGQNVRILMPAPYSEEHDSYLRNYLETGERKIIGIGREVVGKRKDGSTFPLDLSVSEFRTGDRRMFTGIVRDITDRKAAEDALARLNDELELRIENRTRQLQEAQEQLVRKEKLATLGQLAGSVAHEIRNPLGVIRNGVYYLQTIQVAGDSDTRDALEEISRGLGNSERIVSELLDYARGPKPDRSRFLMSSAIKGALTAVRIPPSVTVELPDQTMMEVDADRDQIERVLANLIRNACQAMSGGGILTIQSRHEGAYVVTEVSDTGAGIAPDALESIFEPLFTSRAKGIGLGLPLSRRYAEQNGGTLEVHSTRGKGATFRLVFPGVDHDKQDEDE